jgi:hypothetical protein
MRSVRERQRDQQRLPVNPGDNLLRCFSSSRSNLANQVLGRLQIHSAFILVQTNTHEPVANSGYLGY